MTASKFYQIGDVVVREYGCEQSNVSFYQVVKMTAKKILVRELMKIEVSSSQGGYSKVVMPDVNNFRTINCDEFLLTVKEDDSKDGHRLTGGYKFYDFYKFDNQAKVQTSYA